MPAPIKPKALTPGQTVGLVAPSSAIADPASLDQAIANLESYGYRVKTYDSCRARHGYLAGDDALRAGDINRMFRDDTVDAILCARGGYGVTRLLDDLDYDAIARNPKVFSGYSDVTALHSALRARTGLVTFHGLMAASDMGCTRPDPFSLNAFWRMVSDTAAAGAVENPPGYPRETLVSGYAEGPLIGGNLTMIATCLGTPYAYDFEGAILFLEEVNEKSYCVDRLLTQLRRAGVFQQIAGLVIGEFTGCPPERPEHDFTAGKVLRDLAGTLDMPVLAGLRIGHVTPKLSLPIGIRCALDATGGTLSLLERGVMAQGTASGGLGGSAS